MVSDEMIVEIPDIYLGIRSYVAVFVPPVASFVTVVVGYQTSKDHRPNLLHDPWA